MRNLHIGEFTLSQVGKRKVATFICEVPTSVELVLIIYDKFGAQCVRQAFSLRKGGFPLEFDITHLAGGEYTAWVRVNEQTYLRHLSIEGKQPKSGFLGKFKRLLPLRF